MSKTENQLTVVSDKLGALIEEKQSACPKYFNKTRFLQNCLTVLKEIPSDKLAKLSPDSIALTMVKGAFLGLDFFMGECYAIPFGSELQFLTDYKGDIKLCRQYSIKPIKNIYAELVREGDSFEAKVENGAPTVNHKPVLFSDKPVIGVFAIVIYDDNSMQYAMMSTSEIEATRKNFSKCPGSPAWVKAWGEMAKKTVLKRLTKMIELNFDNAEQDKAYQDGGDLERGREVIDVNSNQVSDPFTKTQPEQPAPEKQPENTEERGDLIVNIEEWLVSQGKDASHIYKYAIDSCKKKPLEKYTVTELIELREYIKAKV